MQKIEKFAISCIVDGSFFSSHTKAADGNLGLSLILAKLENPNSYQLFEILMGVEVQSKKSSPGIGGLMPAQVDSLEYCRLSYKCDSGKNFGLIKHEFGPVS